MVVGAVEKLLDKILELLVIFFTAVLSGVKVCPVAVSFVALGEGS